MITVRLWGGLGNQMFQYAFGRRLAAEHETDLVLDLGWFKYRKAGATTPRIYELGGFELDRHARKRTYPPPKHKSALPWRRPPGLRVISEQRNGFDESALASPNHVWLLGYWQSERYFRSIEGTLRAAFSLREPLPAAERALVDEIETTDSVSIHVRRGDYVADPKVNRAHGVLTLDYYRAAIEEVWKHVDSPTLFVFSDEPDWVERHLESHLPTTYVSTADPRLPAVDMHLMSKCRHHVIANSSFSWWGAWLGDFPDKLVVAPHAWFADPARDSTHFVPDRWLRM